MSGFKVGDKVRVIGNTNPHHHYKIGTEVDIESTNRGGNCYNIRGRSHGPLQIVCESDLELIEECNTMAHNNGDLIKAQVSRDDYGAPVYNLFVKFGEFYYNLSTTKQMRGAKSLPSGTKHTVGTMSGTGDHMLAAIEGKDVPEEVADDSLPFEVNEYMTATEIMRRFDEAFGGSELKTTNKLSNVEYSEKIRADKYL